MDSLESRLTNKAVYMRHSPIAFPPNRANQRLASFFQARQTGFKQSVGDSSFFEFGCRGHGGYEADCLGVRDLPSERFFYIRVECSEILNTERFGDEETSHRATANGAQADILRVEKIARLYVRIPKLLFSDGEGRSHRMFRYRCHL